MTNEIFKEDKIALEIIASGSTLDDDPGYHGDTYQISTWTFRLNHVGLNRWLFSDADLISVHSYGRLEEYEAKKQKYEADREQLVTEIGQLLGIEETKAFTVTKNVSEIFTAVLIRKIEKTEPEKKKTTVAEVLHGSLSILNAMLCYMI